MSSKESRFFDKSCIFDLDLAKNMEAENDLSDGVSAGVSEAGEDSFNSCDIPKTSSVDRDTRVPSETVNVTADFCLPNDTDDFGLPADLMADESIDELNEGGSQDSGPNES